MHCRWQSIQEPCQMSASEGITRTSGIVTDIAQMTAQRRMLLNQDILESVLLWE